MKTHVYVEYATSDLATSRAALWTHLIREHGQRPIDPDKPGRVITLYAMTRNHRNLHNMGTRETR